MFAKNFLPHLLPIKILLVIAFSLTFMGEISAQSSTRGLTGEASSRRSPAEVPLLDLERFRVRVPRNQEGTPEIDPIQKNKGKSDSSKSGRKFDRGDNDVDLASRLRQPSLFSGIVPRGFERTTVHREIPSPSLSFQAQSVHNLVPLKHASIQKVKTWTSPNMAHRALLFEEENLERYGNGMNRFQPIASGAHFFTSVVFLPYKIGANGKECVYSMQYLRPGDCNPAQITIPSRSRRGVASQLLGLGLGLGL